MTITAKIGLGLVFFSLAITGCGDKRTDSPASDRSSSNSSNSKKGASADPDHVHGQGPNGGVVFDLGKYHAEFTVDHGKKECTVRILAGHDKTAKPFPVTAKELTLTTQETKTKDDKVVPPMTITLKPVDEREGKSSQFVGTDPGLGNVADFAGTVTGEIDGKPVRGEFKE